MRFATIAPLMAPAICAGTYATQSRHDSPPNSASTTLTTGLKCAPDTGPNARINATSPPAVAAAFSNSCRPASVDNRGSSDAGAHHDRNEKRRAAVLSEESTPQLQHELAKVSLSSNTA